jgi:hypothetical protein
LSRDSFDDSGVVEQTLHYLVRVHGESNDSADILMKQQGECSIFVEQLYRFELA